MTKKERLELAKVGVLTGEDAVRFNEAIANPKKVSAEEIARIKKSASRIIDKTNPRVNKLEAELSLLTEKYNKLKEAFEELVTSASEYRYSVLYEIQMRTDFRNRWMVKAGLKEQ